MFDLQTLLLDIREPNVYLLETEAAIDVIHQVVVQAGYNFFHLDGKMIRNKKEFLQEAQRVLEFPSYFGHNWDAFDECIADLPSWIAPADGNVILYDNFEVLAQNDPQEVQKAIYGFVRAAQTFTAPQPMYVLLQGDMQAAESIRNEFQLTSVSP
jgi:hypothetical protein